MTLAACSSSVLGLYSDTAVILLLLQVCQWIRVKVERGLDNLIETGLSLIELDQSVDGLSDAMPVDSSHIVSVHPHLITSSMSLCGFCAPCRYWSRSE